MDAKGFVVPAGGGSVLSMAPGRSALLKLLGGETGDSIMLFEETAPAGTDTTFHLHRDSDEVAYVLSGEITFKIGDEVTVRPALSARAGVALRRCEQVIGSWQWPSKAATPMPSRFRLTSATICRPVCRSAKRRR